MYRFTSSIDRITLNNRYLALFSHAKLQEKWNNELSNCPDLARTIPKGKTPSDILVMDYEDLVDLYLRYLGVYNSLTGTRKAALKEASNRVFTYDSYKKAIAGFLADSTNGFQINNCVYCDLTDVRVLNNGKRQFVTEHILDKGECPMVGLSLYNFCPSCGFCNSNCKGTQPIGHNAYQMKKLGPTGRQYDFEHQVKFVLKEDDPKAIGRIKTDHLDWYSLDFDYKDDDYREVVSLFDLYDRYNQDQNKLQALEWRASAQKHRGIAIAIKARFHGRSIEEERKHILHYDLHKKVHSTRLKLMEDMILIG